MTDLAKNKRATSGADQLVGQRIRAMRVARNMSQTTLADAVGVTFQQIQKYENGSNRIATGRLLKLAEVFGVPVGTVLTGIGSNTATKDSAPTQPLTMAEARLLRAFRALDGDVRHAILQLALIIAR